MNDPTHTRDNWSRIQSIFLECVEAPPGDREALLVSRCRGDAELEAAVRSLLVSDESAADFLADPLAGEDFAMPSLGELIDPGEPTGEPLVVGRWQLEHQLEPGPMSTDWMARECEHDAAPAVIVKILRGDLPTGSDQARFLAACDALTGLAHAGLPGLLDHGLLPGDVPWLAFEHVEGGPIRTWCLDHRADLRRRLELVVQLCRILEQAHGQDIVHGMLCPGSVLVTPEGSVCLQDLGVAGLFASPDAKAGVRSLSGGVAITLAYAAPEQLDGGQATPASDVFSIGIILHELLTVHGPYADDVRSDPSALQHALRLIAPSAPSSERLSVLSGSAPSWRGIDVVVRHALEKTPADRYPGAGAMADDLEQIIDGRSPVGDAGRTGRQPGRLASRRDLWIITTLVVLALVIVALIFL